MRLIIVCMLAFVFQLSNPVTEKLKYYESQEKQITFEFHKISKSQRNTESLKLKRKSYYKIFPPKYKTESIAYKSFDPAKWTKEMDQYFDLVDEQIMIKSGGFNWMLKRTKKDIKLSFDRFYGEFITINKVAIGFRHLPAPSPIQLDSSQNIIKSSRDPKDDKHRLRVQEELKAGYIDLQKEIQVCYANSTIIELSKDEYDSEDPNHFMLKRGNWKMEELK